MLANPLYPAQFSPQQPPDEHRQFRPVSDLDAFHKLLPAPVEFVEGSSSGALIVAEGKYEPINVSPKTPRSEERPKSTATQVSPSKNAPTPAKSFKGRSLYSGPIDMTWPTGVTIGAGLYNSGNTCFLNSALQCLLHTPPLLQVLLRHRTEADLCRIRNGFCMTCSMHDVMLNSHKRKQHSAFAPHEITNKLTAIAKHMRRGRQEDSHEFLRYAIDALQKSCLVGLPPKLDPKIAETTWVHKIFGGKLRSRVTCHNCGHNSDTFDSILDLSIDIHGQSSLKDALRNFVAVDYLKGADKYKCEKCKQKVVAEKRFTVHEAPMVLTIHLKRFSPLGRKIGHPVRYDERLSLGPYMSKGSYGPSYSLYGVISHAGGGPNSGHYYAHVKGGKGQWYEMNDDTVTRCQGAPVGKKNAYILFYIRDKGQALEEAVAPKSPNHVARNSLVAGMKKRKVLDTDDEDTIEKSDTKRPFIGPLLPSQTPHTTPAKPTSPVPRDPQADTLKKKIEAVASKSSPVKRSSAMDAVMAYDDSDAEDDVGEKVASSSRADAESTNSPKPSSPQVARPVATTPSLGQSSNSSAIPTSSFYGASAGKKRKSPMDDDEATKDWVRTRMPSSNSPPKSNYKRGSYGMSNPYDRLTNGKHNKNRYGNRKKKLIF